MPNSITLSGQVVNQDGNPVPFVRVEAWDKDLKGKDDFLGSVSTDADGNFKLDPSSGAELFLDKYPDVYFKVIDRNKQLLSTEDNVMKNLKESPDPVTLKVSHAGTKEETKKEPDTSGASVYVVQNQWGGDRAPWHDGGAWVMGIRGSKSQYVVALDISSGDEGRSFLGTMTYAGEGPIGFKATQITGNTYEVENQWGGDTAPWHPGGTWLIGGRDQHVTRVEVKSNDKGKTLEGTMTYAGEGPIGFKAEMSGGCAYLVENRWGGDSAPWNHAGVWVIGTRGDQKAVAVDITSDDKGHSIHGTMTYLGEGPIGLKGDRHGDNEGNNYHVSNQWGGSHAPWHDAGVFVLGDREHQHIVGLKISSDDKGVKFGGTMNYYGEGPIGFSAKLM